MKKLVFVLVCAVMLIAGFVGCKNEADLSEEVLAINLSDGEWNMQMTTFGDKDWIKKEIEVGPKCDITYFMQLLIISDLDESDADKSRKDFYVFNMYYIFENFYYNGNWRSKRELVSQDACKRNIESNMTDPFFEEDKKEYEQNKELYKERYKEFRKNFEEQKLVTSYDYRSKDEYYIEFFVDSSKYKITRSEKTEKIEVASDVSLFNSIYPNLTKNNDGTYSSKAESYSGFTGNDIVAIIANIYTLDTQYYTIKTNHKRTKYKAFFSDKSKSIYENIYLERK